MSAKEESKPEHPKGHFPITEITDHFYSETRGTFYKVKWPESWVKSKNVIAPEAIEQYGVAIRQKTAATRQEKLLKANQHCVETQREPNNILEIK